jgi:hypothetical protein
MQDSKFWRTVAVVFCGGLLYVGHGLHGGMSDAVPSIVNTAKAGGVALSNRLGPEQIYTATPDGKAVYSWRDLGNGQLQFISTANTAEFEAAQLKQQKEARRREEQRQAEQNLAHPEQFGFKPRLQPDKNAQSEKR